MSSDSNAEVDNSSPEGTPLSPDSTSCSSDYSTSATSPSLETIEATPAVTSSRPLSNISLNHNTSFIRNPFEVTPEQRSLVLQSLHARKLRESTPFANLILEYGKSFSTIEMLRKRMVSLQSENDKLRQGLTSGSLSTQGEGGDQILKSTVSELEKRLYETQRDLTVALRGKDENSQKIMDLNEKLRQKDDELNQKELRIKQLEGMLLASETKVEEMSSKIETLEECKQAQSDEYSTLALNCTQLEQRLVKAEEENRQVLNQYMKFKQQYADFLNVENDKFNAKREKENRDTIEKEVRELGKKIEEHAIKLPVSSYILSSDIPNSARNVFEAHDEEVTCVRFLSNNNFITAGMDRKVKIWDGNTPFQGQSLSPSGTFSSCNASVTCVDVDHQETYMVASLYDYTSRVWSLKDHRLKHSLTGHTGKVMAARFIGDDSYKVASGSHDRTIKVWDMKQLTCARILHCHSSCTDLVAVDASMLCSGHLDKRIRFWDIRAHQSDLSTNEILLTAKVTSVNASRDKRDILSCTKDGQLKVVDLRTMSVKSTLGSDNLRIGSDYCRASLSPDGRYAMVGSSDGTVFIFDVNTQKIEKTLKAHQSAVICTTWSNDGTRLLSSDRSKKVVLWSDRA